MPLSRTIGRWLAAAGLLFILSATLYPIPGQERVSAAIPLLCLVCGDQGGMDVILNLLMFLPLAVGLRLAGWRWIQVVAASALLSFTVETLQLVAIPGRDSSLSDLLTNTTSGAIGGAVTPFLRAAADPTPRLARLLLGSGCLLWLAILGLSAWLLAPWAPRGELRSGWANLSPGDYWFPGRVQSVRLDGVPMPSDAPAPDSAAVRERLNRGEAVLGVAAISGSAPSDRTWLYQLRTTRSMTLLTLDQMGRAAYFGVSSRTLGFKLQAPTLRLPNAFPGGPGVAVRLDAGQRGRRLWLASSHGRTNQSISLELSPAHAWSLVMPFGVALGPEAGLLTGLWIGGLILPLGFWAGRAGRPLLGWGTIGATLAAGLGLLPAMTGYVPVHWSEWLAGALGGAAGWALQHSARYLQTRCGSPSNGASFSS